MTLMIPGALLDSRRLRRFISVGIIGASIDLAISWTILFTTTFPPEVAKFIGAECAIIVMFFLNDRWTFQGSPTIGWAMTIRRLVKSNLVRGGGLAVQVTAVFLLLQLPVALEVGGTDFWPMATMPIAIGCGFFANYTGETLVTWRAHR